MTGLYQCESCPFNDDRPTVAIAHETATGHETRARFDTKSAPGGDDGS